MQLINCRKYAREILDDIKNIPNKRGLWILSMGNNPASESYIKGKIRDCEYCGIPYAPIKVVSEELLTDFIEGGNKNPDVAGIIVQLPLPDGIDETPYTQAIAPEKDVDGFTPNSHFKPCTPEAVMYILKCELGEQNLSGKRALIIGRGNLVGKPLIQMLLDADCTVTVAHSKTTNLDELLGQADIIVSAVGKPRLVDLKKCRAMIVIDVGICRTSDGLLTGDCYNYVETGDGMKVTSVPGGIGLMTRAMLMQHTADAGRQVDRR